jgi:hypothetical protein
LIVLSKSASLPISITAEICVVGTWNALCLVVNTNALVVEDKINKRARLIVFETMVLLLMLTALVGCKRRFDELV